MGIWKDFLSIPRQNGFLTTIHGQGKNTVRLYTQYMPGIIIKKFLRNLNDYGFSITLGKSILYLIQPVYENRTYRIYRFELERLWDIPSKESVFAFKVIDRSDTGIIRQIEDMEEWLKGRVASMLEDGGLCLVALDGESVAGFNLVSLGKGYIPLIGLRRTLRENEAWSDQITVNKNYRCIGVGTALRYRIFKELQKRGIRKIYGGAQTSNPASLNLARKVGFKEIADIQYLKIFNKKRLRYKRVVTYGPSLTRGLRTTPDPSLTKEGSCCKKSSPPVSGGVGN